MSSPTQTSGLDSPRADLSQVYTKSGPEIPLKLEPAVVADEKQHGYFLSLLIKLAIVLGIIVFLYLMQLLNLFSKDKIDKSLSLYPRDLWNIWRIFTCTFIHDEFYHLNSLSLFFLVCSICVILRGKARFFWISLCVIVIGNLLSFFFGDNRMNGISSWICGLLGYIYCSVVTDLGYPVKCTVHAMKAVGIAILITIVLIFMMAKNLIPSTTSCWQYNVCGIIAGIVAAYLFTNSKIAVKLGVISEIRDIPSVQVPQEEPTSSHRYVVGKNLTAFHDLRDPLV